MTKTAKGLTNGKVAEISANLNVLSKFGLPGGWALSKNANKAKKSADKYYDLLNQIRDKYCILSSSQRIKYKLLPEYEHLAEKDNKTPIAYDYYDAGDKQDEYIKKLKEASDALCKIQFVKIDMSRKVQSKENPKKSITLGEKIDYEYDIPSNLLIALEGIIFIESNGK